MTNLFTDQLRAIITDVMLILLLCTMATPKYKNKWIYIAAIALIMITNICANSYFYLSENYTAVFYVDFIMLIVIGVTLKPLFSDKIMQWCFSYITMLNIYVAVMFLSYILSDYLPSPTYAMIFLRFVFFSIIVFVLYKRVSVLYRKVLDYWHIYILPIVALFICFLGFLFGGDIEERMIYNSLPLIFLILLGVSIYVTIIHSLNTITEQYTLREERQTMQAEHEYLHLAANSMSQRLSLMDEVSTQNNRASHDRRHFNNLLLELLEDGNCDEAVKLLQKGTAAAPKISRVYCENPVVNAAVSHYATISEQAGIITKIELDIPNEIEVDSLELSMVVSNLMENAIEACNKLNTSTYLRFTCRNIGRLLLEMENPCDESTVLDENSLPKALADGHGIGSKSVFAFSKKYDGELIYKIENGVFNVRLLI